MTLLTQLGSDEEYVFVTHPTEPDWLKPFLGERQTIVRAPHPSQYQPTKKEKIKRVLGPLRPLVRGVKNLVAPAPPENFNIPTSGGFFESLNCDVVHFPYQDYIYCQLPTVYNPHDLQHLHNPEFFAAEEIRRREIVYPAACRAARVVVTASEFVKRDVVENYGIEKEKVEVIRWALPEKKAEKFDEKDVGKLLEKYKCPPRPFALYPAMTWEHKNHIRLLEAVALLRERDKLKVNIVCTGHKNFFYPNIEKRLRELNLENQIQFTGIVEYKELSLFYRLAQFVIIPTLFEAASAPLFEAWQNGTAAACSSVTSLPEQAADAAFLFDPFSVAEIADALKQMATNDGLRENLRVKGTRRLRDFSPERTARAYRAVYKKAAGILLSDDERDLLSGSSGVNPVRSGVN